ncbi:hypothetical protein VL01_17280 [Aeromonas enteropelogenes]|nr:hypothetical protein VL01_17280 [Aeromonas enteropelogenes]
MDPEGLGLGSSVMTVPPSWAAASRPGISRAQLVIAGGQIRAAALSAGGKGRNGAARTDKGDQDNHRQQ